MQKFDEKPELKIICMEDINATEVEWLWYPYIPKGRLTIVQGDPGEGKTTFILQVAAILSRGDYLPFSEQKSNPINVIFQTAEDGLSDTVKPRLIEAHADSSRIYVIDDSEYSLTLSDERIEHAIEETKSRCIILDPIQGYLGAKIDMNRANEIRPVLMRLSSIAEKYNTAIVLLAHMNKGNGIKHIYRGLGSIDFMAAARSVLVVGRINDNPKVRVVAHGKSSLAPEGRSVAFELSEENGFKWLGYYDITVDDLLMGGVRENKSQTAEKMLKDILKDGEVEQKEILERATSIGISKRTLDEVKKGLSIKSKRIGNAWYWKLP